MNKKHTPTTTEATMQKHSRLAETLLPVLTVIGTGIGVIGFVIFFGGFILWTRFDAAGLPANEAVAQVPRSDLIATGASFLVPAFLAASAAAAAAFIWLTTTIGRKWRRHRERLLATMNDAQDELDLLWAQQEQAAKEIEWAQGKMEILEKAPELHTPEPSGDEARASYAAAERLLKEREAWMLDARVNLLPKIKKTRDDANRQLKATDRRSVFERIGYVMFGCLVMFLAEVLAIRSGLRGVPIKEAALVVIAALFSVAIIIVVVLSLTDSIAWLALCVFLGVGITIAVSTYARTHSHPKVSPFVALHAHRLPVTGFFVAETADAVYLGKPEPDWESVGKLKFTKDDAALVRFPKESLSAITIGPLLDEEVAYRRSTYLALVLCRGSVRAGSGTSGREPRCNPAAVRRLHAHLAKLIAHS